MGLLEQYAAMSQPTEEERRKAMTMGLLSAGMGMLAANTSRNFAPAFGRGGLAGLQDYQQQIEAAPAARLRNSIAGMQIHKFNQDVKRQDAIQAMGPQFTDPAAQMLLAGGDFGGAVNRQFPKQEAFTLGPGQSRFVGNAPVATMPEKAPPPPDIVRALETMGYKQGTPEFQKAMGDWVQKQTTHAPAASANVTIKQEGEEKKAVGKFYGEQFGSIQQAGFNSSAKLAKLDRMEQLLTGVETGKLTPAATEVAALAQSFGIKLDPNLDAKQGAQALSREMALELRNPSGGAGMPGAMSDADRQFLVSMAPGLEKTAGGNAMIIQTARAIAKRDAEVAKMARDYRKKNGTIDEGFYDELQKHADANPLFPKSKAAPSPQDVFDEARRRGIVK
jgi:ribosome-binding protein aMBF1 (putative translation factor)